MILCKFCKADLSEVSLSALRCPYCGKPLSDFAEPEVEPANEQGAAAPPAPQAVTTPSAVFVAQGSHEVDSQSSEIKEPPLANAAAQGGTIEPPKWSDLQTAAPEPPSDRPPGETGTWTANHLEQTHDFPEIPTAAWSESDRGHIWEKTVKPGADTKESVKPARATASIGSGVTLGTRSVRYQDERAEPPADYELIEILGKGGMGVVYSARQASVDRLVALKVLNLEKEPATEARHASLTAEAVVTGDLDHPNIVPIHDLGRNETGAVFYSMKCVEGKPWDKVLAEERRKLDTPSADKEKTLAKNLDILLSVADALAFAHDRGVVHRDVKPQNISLGQFGEVLLMDWGLALQMRAFRQRKSVAISGAPGGTPAYMAPEMAEQMKYCVEAGVSFSQEVDKRLMDRIGPHSDVYLLGAVLYEIISGRPPHTGKSVPDCVDAAMRNEIVPTKVEGELLSIALRAMSTDPKDRFADVKAFQNAIREYQGHAASLKLSDRAAEVLATAKAGEEYDAYWRAMAGFDEAIKLWQGNIKAHSELDNVTETFARAALANGDFDLGIRLLKDRTNQRYAKLRKALESGKRAARRRKVLTRVFAITTIAAIAIGGGISWWQWRIAVKAKEEESVAKDAAIRNERSAVWAALDAQFAELRAQEAAIGSQFAELDAVWSEEEAQARRVDAEESATEAKNEREAKRREAYIAQIGLAAKQIDENKFAGARGLLDNLLPSNSTANARNGQASVRGDGAIVFAAAHGNGLEPLKSVAAQNQEADDPLESQKPTEDDLRHWEWGRLSYLSKLAERNIDIRAEVDAVAFAPDGERFVTGSWDGFARIWETSSDSEDPLLEIKHGSAVLAVAFSPDGNYVATGSNDPNDPLCVWDAETGAQKTRLGNPNGQRAERHNGAVRGVAFSRDGRHLLSAGYDNTVQLWEDASYDETTKQSHWRAGKHLDTLPHEDPVWAAVFSPNEKRIATAGQNRRVVIWSSADGQNYELETEFEAHDGPVYAVAFSPDGEHLVTGGAGSKDNLRIWDPNDIWDAAKIWKPGEKPALDRVQSKIVEARLKGLSVPRPKVLRSLPGHTEPVRSVAFSSDGAFLASASDDHTVKVWNMNTGQLVKEFRGHGGWVRSCAFAPHRDSQPQRVVSGGFDRQAKVWNLADYAENRVLGSLIVDGHDGNAVLSARFSANGKRIVTTSRDRTAKVWDWEKHVNEPEVKFTDLEAANQAKALKEGHKYLSTGALFFADGKRLVTSAGDGSVRIWDRARGAELLALGKNKGDRTGQAGALALSSNDRWILTGSDGGFAQLWDAGTGRRLIDPNSDSSHFKLKYKDAEVTAVAFSQEPPGQESRWAFVGDGFGHGRLWQRTSDDGTAWRLVHELDGHGRTITAAAFMPDGRRLLTASGDTSVLMWEVESGHRVEINNRDFVLRHPGWVRSLAVSRDGKHALTSCHVEKKLEPAVRLWDLTSGGLNASAEAGKSISAVAFSRDGRWAFAASEGDSGGNGRGVWCWRTEHLLESPQAADGALLQFRGDDGAKKSLVWSVVFAPDKAQLLTLGGNDARLWDFDEDEEVGKIVQGTSTLPAMSYSPHDAVADASFSPDLNGQQGQQIVTAGWDNSAKIWDVATGLVARKLDGHTGKVNTAVFSPDGKHVLTASDDGTARLWDAQSGAPVATLMVADEGERVHSAAFSKDGQWIVTGSDNLSAPACVWDIAGKRVKELSGPGGHNREVLSAEFSSDGNYIITGGTDNVAILWDRKSATVLKRFVGHSSAVTSVAFSPIAGVPRRVLTGSQDKFAILWDTGLSPSAHEDEAPTPDQDGRLLLTLTGHEKEITSVAFSPDGLNVLTASLDGTAIVWPAEDWRPAAKKTVDVAHSRSETEGITSAVAGMSRTTGFSSSIAPSRSASREVK